MIFNKINIIGLFSHNGGITSATYNLMKVLDKLNVKYTALDVQSNFWDTLKYNTHSTLNIWCFNPDWGRFYEYIRRSRGYNVGFLFWELTQVPQSWHNPLRYLNEIWTYSQMSVKAFSVHNFVPVFSIAPHIEVSPDRRITREDFGLPENSFLFLCMYDALSVRYRKNPIGVIEAFKLAFDKGDKNVGLIVKSSNETDYATIHSAAKDYNNIYFIQKTLPTSRVHGIINLSDCFVSLHRAEGFGLVIAEAMYLGKPVICTNWSGNTDFTYPSNSLLVDYSLVPIKSSYGPFKPGGIWAEPDINAASKCMRRVYTDKDLREEVSIQGMNTIQNKYSLKSSADSISSRLESIGKFMRDSNYYILGRRYVSRYSTIAPNLRRFGRDGRQRVRGSFSNFYNTRR